MSIILNYCKIFLIINFYLIGIYLFGVYISVIHFIDKLELFGLWKGSDNAQPLKTEYDFIIVGAGTAGTTIANGWLCNESGGGGGGDGNLEVIVLEAGGGRLSAQSPFMDIPMVAPALHKTKFDWDHQTVPQRYSCFGLIDQRSRWPMGRGLGGTQIINNMIYERGHPRDYQNWFPKMDGIHFGYPDNSREWEFRENEEFLPLTIVRYYTKLATTFLAAIKEFGNFQNAYLPFVQQLNGRRFTSAHQVYGSGRQPPSKRPRFEYFTKVLRLLTRSELVVERSPNRKESDRRHHHHHHAYGLVYERDDGKEHKLLARRGIILTAGTVGTTQILLMSGIGPKSMYENLTIPFVYDLPVGENLQDHITTGLDLILIEDADDDDDDDDDDGDDVTNPSLDWELPNSWNIFQFKNIYNYFFDNGQSPLSMVGCEAMAFISFSPTATEQPIQNLSSSGSYPMPEFVFRYVKQDKNQNDRFQRQRNNSNQPDLGFMVMPMGMTNDGGALLRHLLNVNDKIWLEYFQPLIHQQNSGGAYKSVSILPILLHPKSRGSISLDPASTTGGRLLIDPNYLSHPDDIEMMVRGIRTIQELIKMPAWRRRFKNIQINPMPLGDCIQNQRFDSDEYWKCYVRHLTFTAYHPVGTCRLGPLSDPRTVVNHYNFQVKGIRNLYVADASVMPNLPSGNPNAAIGMLATRFLYRMGWGDGQQM